MNKWVEDLRQHIDENGEEEMENRRAVDDLRFLHDEGEITQEDFEQQEKAIQLKKAQLALKQEKILEDLKMMEEAQKNLQPQKEVEISYEVEEYHFPKINNELIQEINDNNEKKIELQRDLSEVDIQEKIGKISSLEAKNKKEEIEVKIAELVLKQSQIGNDIEKQPSLDQKNIIDIVEVENANKDPFKETRIENILKTHPVEKIALDEPQSESLPSLEEMETTPTFFQGDFKKFIKNQETHLNNP
jgi:hypothetical protein